MKLHDIQQKYRQYEMKVLPLFFFFFQIFQDTSPNTRMLDTVETDAMIFIIFFLLNSLAEFRIAHMKKLNQIVETYFREEKTINKKIQRE